MTLKSISIRWIFVALTLTPIGFVISGVILGEWVRLKVCYLCNFQRFLYLAMSFFAMWGVLFPRLYRLWSAGVALTALGGAAAAAYQSWMQFAPDPSIECGLGDPTMMERFVDWLGTQWPALFMVTGMCSEKDWVFLGLSLANWSFFIFLSFFAALAGLMFWYRPGKI